MNIELVSSVHSLTNAQKLKNTIDIINRSQADLLLFCGHTIGFVNEIEVLKSKVINKLTHVIFELRDINSSKLGNCLYKIEKGKLESMNTSQLFKQSAEIEDNYQLAGMLLNEFQTKRSFQLFGLNFLIIQCGELNILKNLQAENNRVIFRLSADKELSKQFKNITTGVDVFLNPLHTPMGNQGKMSMRRKFLSQSKRYYFSTSNTNQGSTNTSLKGLQYALFNGKDLEVSHQMLHKSYIVKSYRIEKG